MAWERGYRATVTELMKREYVWHTSLTSRSTLSFVSLAMAISWATLGGSGVETLRGGGLPNSSVMVVRLKSSIARRLRRRRTGWSSAIILEGREGGRDGWREGGREGSEGGRDPREGKEGGSGNVEGEGGKLPINYLCICTK